MDRQLRDRVRDRAEYRCEYCRLRQIHFSQFPHQIEHIVPIKHFGTDAEDNLALACAQCNLAKSSNLSGIDGETGDIVTLFNPRTQGGPAGIGWVAERQDASHSASISS